MEHRATYYDGTGRSYSAAIFLSSITLSIRYISESETKDVYWLAENIQSLEEQPTGWLLKHQNREGHLEKLLVRDPELLQSIRKHFSHHRFIGGWKYRVAGNTRSKIIIFFSIIALFIAAGYFWFVPWLGERIAKNISKEWEISMGAKMHEAMLDQFKVDTTKTKLINEFYQLLDYDVQYPVTITVVDSKEVNAFAVPGGHIVVYESIIARMKKPTELAALLSHEASHIQIRNSLRNLFRSLARKMFLVLLVGNESGIAGFLVNNADDLKGLEYSRSLETEADNHGIQLMKSSGVDPSGMLSLMEILQEETRGKEPAAVLSTHPVFDKRIINIRNQVSSSPGDQTNLKSLDAIFRNLKGVEW